MASATASTERIGCWRTSRFIAGRPSRGRLPAEDRIVHRQRRAQRRDVVYPEHPGAVGVGDHVRSDGAAEPLSHPGAGESADEALPRGAEGDRAPQISQLAEAAVQLEIVLDR